MSNPLGSLIARGEGGYNDYNRGTYTKPNGRQGILPANQEIDFGQMTVGELQRRQHLPKSDPDFVFAVGKYQIVPSTMDEVSARMRLDPNERYTPQLQERIFAEDLLHRKRPDIYAYITDQPGATLQKAQISVAREWASVDDPRTPGLPYGDYAKRGNKSSIRAPEVAEALDEMRTNYLELKAQGKSEAEAWRSVTGQDGPSQSVKPTEVKPEAPQTQGESETKGSVLKLGSRGPEVQALQESLIRLGYTGKDGQPLRPDSNFGSNTDHAVRAFQTAHGLQPVDGKVGPDTRTALAQAAERPLVSEATHPNNGLYNAIGAQMPAGTDPRVTGNVTLQAMENGITDKDKLARMAIQGSDAYLQGTTPGDKVKVDMTAPTPDLQAMSDHMAQQTNERTVEAERNRTRTQEPQTVSV